MDITVNGRRAHAATGGRDGGDDEPAVILIHGAGMDRTVWQMQTRNIAHRGRRAFALDLPGHGRSDGPTLETIVEMADWVAAFMAAAGIAKATLMGHSMGALVALETAVRHPERAEQLVLTGISEAMPVHPDLLAAAAANQPVAAELIVFWGVGDAAQVGGHPQPGLWVRGASEVLVKSAAAGVLGSDLQACTDYGTANDAAAKVGCPSFFVLGRGDKMTPAKSGQALASEIRDARVSVLENCGHMMMIERPNEFYAALKGVIF